MPIPGEQSNGDPSAGWTGASKQAIVIAQERYPLELIIDAWLDSKSKRSKSKHTRRSYERTLRSFLGSLDRAGLDVTSLVEDVALVLQMWAGYLPRGRRGLAYSKVLEQEAHEAGPGTHNQRLAVVSSFYTFARRRQMLSVSANPAELAERARVQAYSSAQALTMERARSILDDLRVTSKTSLLAKRDYALLAIALHTGRRMSELGGLRWRAVQIEQTNGHALVTLTFAAKGGKVMRDELPLSLGNFFVDYVRSVYGVDGIYWRYHPQEDKAVSVYTGTRVGQRGRNGMLEDLCSLNPELPIWISLAHDGGIGRPLSNRAIAYLWERRLGTGKVHSTRHTFARGMQEAGASVADIQARLGHESLATTGIYLQALCSARNNYSDWLAQQLGTNQPVAEDETAEG